jgi:hypothetical protein
MSKKFFFIGVAVLLSASLFMLGCPTDDNDGPTPAQQAVTLAGKLNGIKAGAAVANGATVALRDDVSISASITVPAGVTLVVPSGETLTVPATKTLTVVGTLSVDGSVKLGAAADAKVILQAGAVLDVTANGDLSCGDDHTKVKITIVGGDYWIVPAPWDNGTGSSSTKIVLGKLTLNFTDDPNGVSCDASSPDAAGRLGVGAGTVITFGGTSG